MGVWDKKGTVRKIKEINERLSVCVLEKKRRKSKGEGVCVCVSVWVC